VVGLPTDRFKRLTGCMAVHAKTSSRSSLFLSMNRRSSLRSRRGLRPRNRRFLCLGAHPFESVSSIWGGVSAHEGDVGLFDT